MDVMYLPLEKGQQVSRNQIGGKAMGLYQLLSRGLPVPKGFVLTQAFFHPWLITLQQTQHWIAYLKSSGLAQKRQLHYLKEAALALPLYEHQKAALDALSIHLAGAGALVLRSSAIVEDDDYHSYAGEFATLHHVSFGELEASVKQVFAAVFDDQVYDYKQNQSLSLTDFGFALVAMEQVKADVAGVTFSMNPVSNDYDQMVVNASRASEAPNMDQPMDEWVIEKRTQEIVTVHSVSSSGPCLKEERVLELARHMLKIEDMFSEAIDLEWAFTDTGFYTLQIRPITTRLSLPKALLSEPAAPRHRYLNLGMLIGGLHKPMSPLSNSLLNAVSEVVSHHIYGDDRAVTGLTPPIVFAQGQWLLNIEAAEKVFGKPTVKQFIKTFAPQYESILCADEVHSDWAADSILSTYLWKPGAQSRRFGWVCRQFPSKARTLIKSRIEAFVDDLDMTNRSTLALSERIQKLLSAYTKLALNTFLPALLVAENAQRSLKQHLHGPQADALLTCFQQNVPYTLGLQMGRDMERLSEHVDCRQYATFDAFAASFQEHNLSEDFKKAWYVFMKHYGFRGAGEFDIAGTRFKDDPMAVLRGLYFLAQNREKNHAQVAPSNIEADILGLVKPEARRQVKHWLNQLACFGGMKENLKYYWIMIVHYIRYFSDKYASTLVETLRLTEPEDIFFLSLTEIEQLEHHSQWHAKEAVSYAKSLHQQSHHLLYEPLFDSRGQILGGSVHSDAGLKGVGISRGIARGPVRYIGSPSSATIQPGDILVAKVVDTGWTPLFLQASAILLEVGSTLQHAAIVTREYHKPCVAGLSQLDRAFKEGEWVEVNGQEGTVTRIAPMSAQTHSLGASVDA